MSAVIGWGIAAVRLSPTDVGLQLLMNSLVTGAALVALILVLQQVSAAFNPVVTQVRDDRAKDPSDDLGHITAAYWFTSSMSFPNPAVTIARMLSGTFAGIAPSSVLMFILMQLIGGLLGLGLIRLLYPAAAALAGQVAARPAGMTPRPTPRAL